MTVAIESADLVVNVKQVASLLHSIHDWLRGCNLEHALQHTKSMMRDPVFMASIWNCRCAHAKCVSHAKFHTIRKLVTLHGGNSTALPRHRLPTSCLSRLRMCTSHCTCDLLMEVPKLGFVGIWG